MRDSSTRVKQLLEGIERLSRSRVLQELHIGCGVLESRG